MSEFEESVEINEADYQQKHQTASIDNSNIRIVSPITEDHLPQACQVIQDAFSTKRCCLVLQTTESLSEMKKRHGKMPPAKRPLGAVAIDSSTNKVVGYVQMATSGMPVYPMNLHKCTSDEYYIEILGVSSEARGKGVGTKLLEWCLEKAMSNDKISRLTLEVLRGNRAISLYQRFGFEIQPVDGCEECCGALFILFCFGRPYGCCSLEWGSVLMEMKLDNRREPAKATVSMER